MMTRAEYEAQLVRLMADLVCATPAVRMLAEELPDGSAVLHMMCVRCQVKAPPFTGRGHTNEQCAEHVMAFCEAHGHEVQAS